MDAPARIHLFVSGTFAEMLQQRHMVAPFAGLGFHGRFARGRGVWQELVATPDTLARIIFEADARLLDAVTSDENTALARGTRRVRDALARQHDICVCGHQWTAHWTEGGASFASCLSGRGTPHECACPAFTPAAPKENPDGQPSRD